MTFVDAGSVPCRERLQSRIDYGDDCVLPNGRQLHKALGQINMTFLIKRLLFSHGSRCWRRCCVVLPKGSDCPAYFYRHRSQHRGSQEPRASRPGCFYARAISGLQ